jgi:hypothetical protein
MAKTAKLTFRVNARSPKYGYGFHRIQNGWRFDIPWHSLTVFDGGGINKRTIRSNKSGLRWIVENNRKSKTRVAHNVA